MRTAENTMFTVSYTYYNKYSHSKQFATYASAKKFFWFIQRKSGVTKTELRSA